MESTYQIGKNVYLVTFIQCQPGFEEEICSALTDFLRDRDPEYRIYFSFSEYDIVVILKLEEDDFELPTRFNHRKIRDLQQVVCYSQMSTLNKMPDGAALTITLLKFDEKTVTNNGITIEKSAIKLVESVSKDAKQNKTASILLGTLGWPEAIFIQWGQNLEYMLDNVAQLAADGRKYGNLQICHTIPCFTRVQIEGGGFSGAEVDGFVENWRISISCKPFSILSLSQKIKQLINIEPSNPIIELYATYGRRDLLIYPDKACEKPTRINSVMKILSKIRSTFSSEIIASTTDLGTQIFDYAAELVENNDDEKLAQNRELNLAEDFEKLIKDVQDFSSWELARNNLTLKQSSQLMQMVFRLQAIATTPGLESIVNDTFEFVRAAVRKARNQKRRVQTILLNEENRKNYTELEEMENVYMFGLEQRIAGARLGLGHPSQAYSNLQGLGIQRILRAARAIPFGLLAGVNEDIARQWWGFTVFGFQNETFTLTSGVINLPYQDMLHPEEWWRLGHECGHAFGMITDLIDNPILKNTIDRLDAKIINELIGMEPSQVVDELAVSVFEYLYCYRGDFELYIETTWSFFDHWLEGVHNVTRLKQYLLRAVFVYFFHLQINEVIKPRERVGDIFLRGENKRTLFDGNISEALKERAFRESKSIEELIIRSVMERIDEVIERTKYTVRQADISDVAKAYMHIEFLRSDLQDLYEKYMGESGLKKLILNDVRKRTQKIANMLIKGKIINILENKVDIFLIPLALNLLKRSNGNKVISQRTRIAAILSLWHHDRAWHREIMDDWTTSPLDR